MYIDIYRYIYIYRKRLKDTVHTRSDVLIFVEKRRERQTGRGRKM